MTTPDDPFKKTGEPYRPPGDPLPGGDTGGSAAYGQPAGPGYGAPGYGGQGYGAPPGGYGPPPSSGTNGVAIAALVVGVLALVTFFTVLGGILLGLLAVVLGVLGLRRAKRTGNGRGLAVAGIVTGVLGLLAAAAIAAFVGNLLTGESGQELQECVEQAQSQAEVTECQREFEDQVLN